MTVAAAAAAPETCLHCGEAWFLEVLEYWAEERAWMFDACCEGAHADACLDAADDPRGFAKWFEGETGCPTRRCYSSSSEYALRLDYGLEIREVELAEAKRFVGEHHRHCAIPAGWRWGHAVYNGSTLVAVAMVGRPASRRLAERVYCPRHRHVASAPTKKQLKAGAEWPRCPDCGQEMLWETVEVNRLCVHPGLDPELVWNACSMLYAAAGRTAKEHGYDRVVTYTMEHESGGSVQAAGWIAAHETKAESWDRGSRRRTGGGAPACRKTRWELGLNKRAKKDIRAAAERLAAKRARRAKRDARP